MSSISKPSHIPELNLSLFPSLTIDKNCSQFDTSMYSERDAILHQINNCLIMFDKEKNFKGTKRNEGYSKRGVP